MAVQSGMVTKTSVSLGSSLGAGGIAAHTDAKLSRKAAQTWRRHPADWMGARGFMIDIDGTIIVKSSLCTNWTRTGAICFCESPANRGTACPWAQTDWRSRTMTGRGRRHEALA